MPFGELARLFHCLLGGVQCTQLIRCPLGKQFYYHGRIGWCGVDEWNHRMASWAPTKGMALVCICVDIVCDRFRTEGALALRRAHLVNY